MPSLLEGCSPLSGTSPILSRHESSWTDVLDTVQRDRDQAPGSPSSVSDSIHSTLETFDEYLAKLSHSQSYPSPKFLLLDGPSSDGQTSGAADGPEVGSPLIISDDDMPLESEPRLRLSHQGLSTS